MQQCTSYSHAMTSWLVTVVVTLHGTVAPTGSGGHRVRVAPEQPPHDQPRAPGSTARTGIHGRLRVHETVHYSIVLFKAGPAVTMPLLPRDVIRRFVRRGGGIRGSLGRPGR